MSSKTTNLHLLKPADREEEWGGLLNTNFDILDNKISDSYTVATKQFFSCGIVEFFNIDTVQCTNTTITIPRIRFFSPIIPISLSDTELPQTMVASGFTINSNEFNTIADGTYKRYFFGYRYNDSNSMWELIKNCEDIEEFDIGNNKNLFYGYFVVYKNTNEDAKFVPNLFVFKPWFSSYTTNDRIIDMHTHGTFKGGYIESLTSTTLNGISIRPKITNGKYIWAHEGINYSNAYAPHFKYTAAASELNTTINTYNPISFFRASADGKINISEVNNEYTILDPTKFSYKNSEQEWELKTLDEGYNYSIQRYCILENGKSVVYYGNEEFVSKEDAEAGLALLQPINTMMFCKEVARIIIKKDNSDVTIYNIQELEETEQNDILNMNTFTLYNNENNNKRTIKFNTDKGNHKLFIDPAKTNYTIADAADIKTTGIFPGGSITFDSTNNKLTYNFTALLVNKNTNFISPSNSSIQYKTYNGYSILDVSSKAETWYYIICDFTKNNDQNPIKVENSTTATDIILGKLYVKNGTGEVPTKIIDFITIKPQLATTDFNSRNDYLIIPLSVKDGQIAITTSEVTTDNDKVVTSAYTFKGEGINFTNINNPDIKQYVGGRINFKYNFYNPNAQTVKWYLSSLVDTIDRTKYYSIEDEQIKNVPNNKYTIQKILLTSNDDFIIQYGNKVYDDASSAINNVLNTDDTVYTPKENFIELCRIIVGNNNVPIVSYYTNRYIYGNITIETVDPSSIIPHYKDQSSISTEMFWVENQSQTGKFTFNAQDLTGNTVIKSTTPGVMRIDGIADKELNQDEDDNNAYIGWDAEENKYVNRIIDASELTDTGNRFTSSAVTLKNNLNTNNHLDIDNISYAMKLYKSNTAPSPTDADRKFEYIWIDTSAVAPPYNIKIWNGSYWEIINAWQ